MNQCGSVMGRQIAWIASMAAKLLCAVCLCWKFSKILSKKGPGMRSSARLQVAPYTQCTEPQQVQFEIKPGQSGKNISEIQNLQLFFSLSSPLKNRDTCSYGKQKIAPRLCPYVFILSTYWTKDSLFKKIYLEYSWKFWWCWTFAPTPLKWTPFWQFTFVYL